MHIVRGVAEDCIIPMLKKFSRYNKEFLSPEEVSAITDKEYIEPKNDNEYDIKMTLESAETRVAKAERTGFVLQTMGPNMPPQAMTVLLARYMKLIGELDVSHMIKNPEVSPEEQQAQAKQQAHADKMMELELALMEAKVYNEQAKGQENAVDVELKTAKTETERAKARITNSDSDLKDIDYLEREAGIPHERELEKEERKVMNKSQNN